MRLKKKCFVVNHWGKEKLDWPILLQPWKVKASILCRWLFGWRKPGLAHSFPTSASESNNLTLSGRICIQPKARLLQCKTGLSPPVIYYWRFQGDSSVVVYLIVSVRPPFLTSESIIFPTLACASLNLVQMVIWVKKNWAGQFYLHAN